MVDFEWLNYQLKCPNHWVPEEQKDTPLTSDHRCSKYLRFCHKETCPEYPEFLLRNKSEVEK